MSHDNIITMGGRDRAPRNQPDTARILMAIALQLPERWVAHVMATRPREVVSIDVASPHGMRECIVQLRIERIAVHRERQVITGWLITMRTVEPSLMGREWCLTNATEVEVLEHEWTLDGESAIGDGIGAFCRSAELANTHARAMLDHLHAMHRAATQQQNGGGDVA